MGNEELVEYISQLVLNELKSLNNEAELVPVGVSARHVHISEEDFKVLFGENGKLTVYKELSQPNQFASEQKVDLVGKKGTLKNLRILGPFRDKTQVEITTSECRILGFEKVPVRQSGNLKNSCGVTIVGPCGKVTLKEGVIIAVRHIHATTKDALRLGVKDGDVVDVTVDGDKGGVLSNVIVRVNDAYKLELHIDTDDANAFKILNEKKLKVEVGKK